MKYYKLISGQTFVGIANSSNFLAQNPISKWLLAADEVTGQYVSCNNQLYRDYWMCALNEDSQIPFTNVDIIEINKEEYDIYSEAIEKNEEIIVPDTTYTDVNTVVEEEVDSPSVEFVRSSKLNEMSYACRTTIEAGFDLELRGEIHHFSLDTQDQLNLISLSAMAQTQSLIPYHADGEACIFYTNEEIEQIVETATAFKIYHTTYYNALKGYINALNSIEDISAVEYGIEIPEEYQSDVLKAIS